MPPRPPLLRARFQPPHSRSKRHRPVPTVIPYGNRVSRRTPPGAPAPTSVRGLCPHWGRRFAASRNCPTLLLLRHPNRVFRSGHCSLQYVLRKQMTNQSLRERFDLPESKTATISQTIAAAVDAELIKPSDPGKASTRYRSYVPIWA